MGGEQMVPVSLFWHVGTAVGPRHCWPPLLTDVTRDDVTARRRHSAATRGLSRRRAWTTRPRLHSCRVLPAVTDGNGSSL